MIWREIIQTFHFVVVSCQVFNQKFPVWEYSIFAFISLYLSIFLKLLCFQESEANFFLEKKQTYSKAKKQQLARGMDLECRTVPDVLAWIASQDKNNKPAKVRMKDSVL